MRQPVIWLMVFVFCGVAAMSLVPAAQVFAQTKPATAAATTPTPLATPSSLATPTLKPIPATTGQSMEDTAQLSTLRDQYRIQLNVYRTDQHNFELARDQYYQLQTLTSLEDAVKATQKVLLSRDDLLSIYLKMLRLTFEDTTGIQLSLKNIYLKAIDELAVDVNKNHDLSSRAVSRDQVRLAVADFAVFSSTLQQDSSQAILVISYGKVRSLFDKTLAARDEIKAHVLSQETDALKLSEKQRAFEQIDQTTTAIDGQLKSVLSDLDGTQKNPVVKPAEQLNQAYAGISRTLSYLQEVLNK